MALKMDPNITNYLAVVRDALSQWTTSDLGRLAKSAYTCSYLEQVVELLKQQHDRNRFVTTGDETLCITGDSVLSFIFTDEPELKNLDNQNYPLINTRLAHYIPTLDKFHQKFKESGGSLFERRTPNRFLLNRISHDDLVKSMFRNKEFFTKFFSMYPRDFIYNTPLREGLQSARPIRLGDVFEHCTPKFGNRLTRRQDVLPTRDTVLPTRDTVTGMGWYCESVHGHFGAVSTPPRDRYIVLEVEEHGTGEIYGHYQSIHLATPF